MLLEKLAESSCPPVCGASNAAAMTSGRCELRKLYAAKHPVHAPENFKMTKFSKKLKNLIPQINAVLCAKSPCGLHKMDF